MTKTQDEVRKEFAHYFIDLDESSKKEGFRVSKASEWESFLNAQIDMGYITASAIHWKCPRSVKALIS